MAQTIERRDKVLSFSFNLHYSIKDYTDAQSVLYGAKYCKNIPFLVTFQLYPFLERLHEYGVISFQLLPNFSKISTNPFIINTMHIQRFEAVQDLTDLVEHTFKMNASYSTMFEGKIYELWLTTRRLFGQFSNGTHPLTGAALVRDPLTETSKFRDRLNGLKVDLMISDLSLIDQIPLF
jgi:hypothetical protein